MLLQFFKPFDSTAETFQGNKKFDIANVISFTYTQKLADIGSFTIQIPYNNKVKQDYLIWNGKQWLIITGVSHADGITTLTGTDLKGYLSYRVTLHDIEDDDTVQGYDVQSGSTEAILKHYVDYNIVNPSDTNRAILKMTNAVNQNRGIATDVYMSRFEAVSKVVKNMCENANIGYDVTADTSNNNFVFDIVPIVDKTANQSVRNRVIFEISRKNVSSIERKYDESKYKNVFYATKSGSTYVDEAVTVLCTRTNETVTANYKRKEIQVSVSCDSVADISAYAKKEEEKYLQIDTIRLEISDFSEYGSAYKIGDKVTVKDGDFSTDLTITEAVFTGENGVSITLGNAEDKPLAEIKKQINNIKEV